MNKKIATILLICTAFYFSACQKNIDVFVPDAGSSNGLDTTWTASIAATAPVLSLQSNLVLLNESAAKDSFETNTNTAIVTASNGLQVTIPPHSCVNSNGQFVTGKIFIETRLIRSKGDMVQLNKPTSSNGRLLVSGGELFISLRKDTQLISIAPGAKIYVKYADAATNQAMKLFFGDESDPAQFNWVPNTSTDTLSVGSQNYEMAISHLRWINCDYFYDTANITRTAVAAVLPNNYTNANTSSFVVFKEIRSVMGMYADVPERRFLSSKLPNGKTATVVVLSKQGNDYFSGKESITIGLNTTPGVIQKVNITPIKKSLADIKAYLATL
ncbi:hypothetical protein [Ferruginibacter sp.]